MCTFVGKCQAVDFSLANGAGRPRTQLFRDAVPRRRNGAAEGDPQSICSDSDVPCGHSGAEERSRQSQYFCFRSLSASLCVPSEPSLQCIVLVWQRRSGRERERGCSQERRVGTACPPCPRAKQSERERDRETHAQFGEGGGQECLGGGSFTLHSSSTLAKERRTQAKEREREQPPQKTRYLLEVLTASYCTYLFACCLIASTGGSCQP